MFTQNYVPCLFNSNTVLSNINELKFYIYAYMRSKGRCRKFVHPVRKQAFDDLLNPLKLKPLKKKSPDQKKSYVSAVPYNFFMIYGFDREKEFEVF